MNKYEVIGQQIVDFLNDPVQKATRLLSTVGTRFIVCGTSGSGKTLAIEYANNLLPAGEQIAESQDLVRERCPDRAMEIFTDEGIQEADTLLLTVPNQLGVDYNAHLLESIVTHVALVGDASRR